MSAKKTTETSIEELSALNRIQRCSDFAAHLPVSTSVARAKVRSTAPATPPPRSLLKPTWKSMEDRIIKEKDSPRTLETKGVSAKLQDNADYIGTYHNYNGVIRPEYDMMEPFVIHDTEVFLQRAVARKLSLMFRNGFEIISTLDSELDQGQKNVDYISRRLDVMEYVMNQPTEEFFRSVLFNLLLCSNCFLRKIRDEKASPGTKTDLNGKKIPIAGYSLIPSHEIMPYLKKGRIEKWRRFFTNGAPYEDIPVEDIVHLRWDSKPGHIYGTPRTVGVRDDIFALRRLEENIELLFINHLFPLFHVKVGNEKQPAWYGPNGQSEIDIIKYEIETMPKEGVFVSDERVEVDSIGAEGQSLSTDKLIDHLKGRVLTGLGVSPLDVGEGDTANRATADNISQVLKDAVKADLDTFGGLLRIQFFKDWFMEANYSLSVQKAVATTTLHFHEIDLDNLIKEQNHVIQLFNSHLITEEEARQWLRRKPIDAKMRKVLHFDLHVVRLVKETAKAKAEAEMEVMTHGHGHDKALAEQQHKHTQAEAETQMALLEKTGEVEATKAMAHAHKAEAQTKLTHAKTKHAIAVGSLSAKGATPTRKSAQNKNTPTNQHGSNPGPTRAKSAFEGFHELLKDRLLATRQTLIDEGKWEEAGWHNVSGEVVDTLMAELEAQEMGLEAENSYTNQVRMSKDRLKDLISQTSDPDLLAILLDSEAEDSHDDGTEVESNPTDPASAGTD
jgi:hypothetical protein